MNVTCQPGAEVNVDALLAAARAKLPAYMVPTSVRVLSQMPRLPNGKVGAGLEAIIPMCITLPVAVTLVDYTHWPNTAGDITKHCT